MEGDVIDPLVKAFFALMDNQSQDWTAVLHEDAVLDWFGRCFVGIKQIRTFVRERVDQTSHSIDTIKSCPRIKHRCLKQKTRKRPAEQEVEKVEKGPLLVECGQGDGWGINQTPPNRSIPYDMSIMKAPKVKTVSDFKLDESEPLYFFKIMGTLKLKNRSSYESDADFQYEKQVKHIIIACSNGEVRLVVYEGMKSCKRSLKNEFSLLA